MQQAIADNFVPLKLISTDAREATRHYGVRWLPAFLVLDAEGVCHHKVIGYLSPDDLRAELLFGAGLFHIAAKQYDAACQSFESIERQLPQAAQLPEALFWWGVTRVRQTKDFAQGLRVWERLVQGHPDSLAARKISFVFEA